MPELPEVEAVCRKLRRDAAGARILAATVQRRRITHPLAPEAVEEACRGKIIQGVERRGKNIFINLSGGLTLHVHLRMTGNLYVAPDHRLRPRSLNAWFALVDGRGVFFEDSRGLGTLTVLDAAARAARLDQIGPEPLSREFTAEAFAASARASRQPAKLFLLDQRRLAGIGNIYAAEALFAARIHPERPINAVRVPKLRTLHAAIVRILRDAVKSAYIAYSRPGGFREAEEYVPAVYGREGDSCGVCGRPIRRIAQGGRSTYFCPKCQR